MPTPTIDFIDELKWRGLFHQCTDEAGLRAHLKSGTRRAYAGFDPTADSLTIGNLVPIMLLLHFQRAGHEPVVVMGGGTGLIGDPSGKSAERMLMTEGQVRSNVEKQTPIFERVFVNGAEMERRPARVPTVVNNLDWLGKLGYLEVLRDVGKHFSVNMMVQKDSVRERLHARDQGISYTEFSYMVLQAYDFMHLEYEGRRYGLGGPVSVQLGGSDQWGNIVAGVELTRKAFYGLNSMPQVIVEVAGYEPGQPMPIMPTAQLREPPPAFGLTAPLVTKSDGGKFGKTESGAIWLSPATTRAGPCTAWTSPYAFSQFWLNAADADAGRYLRLFTLMSKSEIEALEADHAKEPGERKAQRRLAREVTTLVHGKAEADAAEAAARALFSGEIAHVPAATLAEAFAEVPSSDHDKAILGAGIALAELLPLTSLCKSKREARELLQGGSLSVNGRKAGADDRLTVKDLLHGAIIALRRGKKTWHVTRWR